LTAVLSSRAPVGAVPRPAAPWSGISAIPLLVLSLSILVPLAGLIAPLAPSRWATVANQPHAGIAALWAFAEVMRTLVSTVLYAGGAAAVGISLALLWTLAVGRSARLLLVSTGLLLPLLALPSAASALGLARLASFMPGWADDLARGRLAVCVALGLRLAPVATLLILRAYEATPRSWSLAAALHGVGLPRFLVSILLPALAPAMLLAALAIALLASVDVTTVLVLHPPGHASLPLSIFTVMANAPEYQVATLCLVYIGLAAAGLAGLRSLAARVASG
jgi:iron(III) transport system permease protein